MFSASEPTSGSAPWPGPPPGSRSSGARHPPGPPADGWTWHLRRGGIEGSGYCKWPEFFSKKRTLQNINLAIDQTCQGGVIPPPLTAPPPLEIYPPLATQNPHRIYSGMPGERLAIPLFVRGERSRNNFGVWGRAARKFGRGERSCMGEGR